MALTEEKILTRHPSGKSGVYIPRRDYDRVSNFILSALKSTELTIYDLLDRAEAQLTHDVSNVAWCVLAVKLDLEAKGLIAMVSRSTPCKATFLKLKRGAIRKYKSHMESDGFRLLLR